MRAITYTQTGDPDVLTLVDRPLADPGPGEVRVRIHRSGVNPTDWKARRGAKPGLRVNPPQVPNQDGAGVVDAVGPGVEDALLGLRVWVWEAAYQRPEGTAQEYSLVPRHNVAHLPDVASFDLGASLGVPFLTAHRALTVTEGGPLRLGPGTLQGRTVLVSGGAGATWTGPESRELPPDPGPAARPAVTGATVEAMRAIVYTRTGDPDVLTLVDRPLAEPGAGEVRVRVHRSGVNPTDWKARSGARAGTPVDPPQVPNQDGAGVVDAVGP
ncbi:MAG TPA: alcohol dehydrogenase catalytic domain-containing protein, partial [Nocardioides sp.]|nr:alcohol dehydrogenase catalytic domain-containing protein [Nocardioides sp.]